MNRLCCFTLFSAVLGAASTVAAQASLPVSVTGGGTVSYFTAIPTEWTPFGGEGTISFNGVDLAYTLTSADVGGLMVTDGGPPVVANFSNSVPVTFSSTDPGDDSEISMNYQGVVTLTPASDTEFTGVFVADFTPIVGSGTGIFAGVIGGGFEMTAIADTPFVARLDESQVDGLTLDAPYEWGTTGGANDFFQVVPEPTALVLGALAVLAGATRRRGASPLS